MDFHKQISSFFIQYPLRNYKKNSLVFQPEEPISAIFYIKSGVIRSYAVSEEGKELTINLYKPSSFFPISTYLSGKNNSYYYETIIDSNIYTAPVEDVIAFLHSDQKILFDLTRRLSIGLEGFMIRTLFLLSSKARQKLASTLLMLAKRFGETAKTGTYITLPLTHELLGSLSGLTRETTTIELNKLVKERLLIKKGKHIVLSDSVKLQKIALLYQDSIPLPYTF